MTEPTRTEPTLADLAAASGLESRTIRSWVAQGVLPPPLTRGPAARYPIDTLQRLLAVQVMRETLGMSLSEIRKELLVATPNQIAAHAARATKAPTSSSFEGDSDRTNASKSALDYIARVRASAVVAPPNQDQAASSVTTGYEALELRLGQGKSSSARKARAEEWLRIPITPDVELSVRGPLDLEQRTRLERCADLIRNTLLGREK